MDVVLAAHHSAALRVELLPVDQTGHEHPRGGGATRVARARRPVHQLVPTNSHEVADDARAVTLFVGVRAHAPDQIVGTAIVNGDAVRRFPASQSADKASRATCPAPAPPHSAAIDAA
jgi:hypothetical protein